MLKNIWIRFMTAWVSAGMLFWFKNFKVYGKKNVPKNKPVIFLPNHQNTFLDPLVQVVTLKNFSHYLARGDVFSNVFTKKLAASLNLRPIYRQRDNENYIEKNEEVFEELYHYLSKGESVTLYSEGAHSLRYHLRPLKKGFTRIAFGAMERFPDLDIQIVPVGINYSDHLNFRSSVSIHFGEAFAVRPFFEMQNASRGASELRKKAENSLRQLVIDLPKENYLHYHRKLKDELQADFSNRELTQRMADDLADGKDPKKPARPNQAYWWERLLFPLVFINNIIPILLWKKLKPVFKDVAFYGAIKFAIGTFVVPVAYLLQSLLVWWLAGLPWALVYLFLSLVSVPVLRIRRDQVPDKSLS